MTLSKMTFRLTSDLFGSKSAVRVLSGVSCSSPVAEGPACGVRGKNFAKTSWDFSCCGVRGKNFLTSSAVVDGAEPWRNESIPVYIYKYLKYFSSPENDIGARSCSFLCTASTWKGDLVSDPRLRVLGISAFHSQIPLPSLFQLAYVAET